MNKNKHVTCAKLAGQDSLTRLELKAHPTFPFWWSNSKTVLWLGSVLERLGSIQDGTLSCPLVIRSPRRFISPGLYGASELTTCAKNRQILLWGRASSQFRIVSHLLLTDNGQIEFNKTWYECKKLITLLTFAVRALNTNFIWANSGKYHSGHCFSCLAAKTGLVTNIQWRL